MTQKIRKIVVHQERCPQNHPCPVTRRCPTGAIVQKNPHSAPYIVEEKCQNCGVCTRMCPVFQIPAL